MKNEKRIRTTRRETSSRYTQQALATPWLLVRSQADGGEQKTNRTKENEKIPRPVIRWAQRIFEALLLVTFAPPSKDSVPESAKYRRDQHQQAKQGKEKNKGSRLKTHRNIFHIASTHQTHHKSSPGSLLYIQASSKAQRF
jgi:hypothetical protein